MNFRRLASVGGITINFQHRTLFLPLGFEFFDSDEGFLEVLMDDVFHGSGVHDDVLFPLDPPEPGPEEPEGPNMDMRP